MINQFFYNKSMVIIKSIVINNELFSKSSKVYNVFKPNIF